MVGEVSAALTTPVGSDLESATFADSYYSPIMTQLSAIAKESLLRTGLGYVALPTCLLRKQPFGGA